MTDTKQPEALRLAHIFDCPLPPEWTDMVAAATELRRQHAENTALQQGYDAARLEIEALRKREGMHRMSTLDGICLESTMSYALHQKITGTWDDKHYPELPISAGLVTTQEPITVGGWVKHLEEPGFTEDQLRAYADATCAMRAQADSQPVLPKITAEDRSLLHYNPNTDDIVEWVQRYASAAITADRAMRAQVAPAALAQLRIGQHQQREFARLEAERARIRAEEERRAREKAELEETAERVKAEQAAQAEVEKAGTALLQQAKEQADSLVQMARAIDREADTCETLTLGAINALLSPIRIDAAGLAKEGQAMTDTTSAAPSDAEIDAQWRESVSKHETTAAFVRDFARAVLARWGAPQPALDCHHRPPCDECAAYDAQGGK